MNGIASRTNDFGPFRKWKNRETPPIGVCCVYFLRLCVWYVCFLCKYGGDREIEIEQIESVDRECCFFYVICFE